ncbi:hypothetical protein BGZ83_003336, partial [Gryganskiella cystojenkinii]
ATIAKSKGHIPNIEVVSLPKNSTSVTQPLDAGMIAVFKVIFKDLLAMEKATRALSNPFADPFQESSSSSLPGPSVTKISNYDGWRFIADGWDAIKTDSIRHCFHHVPIIDEIQKKELAGKSKDLDVTRALKESQKNALQQAQILVARFADQGEDQESPISGDDGDDEDETEGKQAMSLEVKASKAISGPDRLSLMMVKLLEDQLPVLDKISTKEGLDEHFFMKKFHNPSPYLYLLGEGDLVETDPEDIEFLGGSPIRRQLYQADDDGDHKTPEELLFIRGQLHEKLTSAAGLMRHFPSPIRKKKQKFQLMADSLLTQDYTDSSTMGYVEKFLAGQAKDFATFLEEQAARNLEREKQKAGIEEEKKRLDEAFPPPSKRPHPFSFVE